MNTIIAPLHSVRRRQPQAASVAVSRQPHYDCQEADGVVRLTLYVPGIDAAGVEITTQGPDLTVTARKSRIVRVNGRALHLERNQRDYRLDLRLGRGLAYEDLHAELREGVLTLVVPKRTALSTHQLSRGRNAA
jgi:HSP20 family protein